MPLINFRTNLTSLKYGQPDTGDRPGGGYSGQPFIQAPIDNGNVADPFATYYSANRTSLDFPIRGGSITQLVEGGDATISAAIDVRRIQAFFKDKPRGTTFIEKQKGLGLTNPRTQVPQALEFAGLSLGNVVLPVTQTYSELNTLAQVRVSGTGAHFNRQGVAPNIYENPRLTYAYLAGDPSNNTEGTNRLSILRALKLVGSTNFINNSNTSTGQGIDPGLIDKMGISLLQNQIYNYLGGPGSVYGIGYTIVDRVVDTQPLEDQSTGIVYSTIGMTYQQLASQPDRGTNKAHPTPQDFRQQLNDESPDLIPLLPTFDYKAESLEGRLKIGNPGQGLNDYADYTSATLEGQDQLNMLNPFYYDASTYTPWNVPNSTNPNTTTKDIIKFAFECLDNNYSGNAVALIFRAFLDGTITDNNTAEYSTFKYLGRGETFRTYQGFNRSLSFTFKIAAQSRQEMKPLYNKLNQLVSQIYPDYSPGTNIMRGNVVRLTIGDYIYRMPGFLESVNITIENSNTPWEIVLNPNEVNDVAQLPHYVTIACTFFPIMDILPSKITFDNVNNRYIGNVSGSAFGNGVIKDPTSILGGRVVAAQPTQAAPAAQPAAPVVQPTAPVQTSTTPVQTPAQAPVTTTTKKAVQRKKAPTSKSVPTIVNASAVRAQSSTSARPTFGKAAGF